MVQRHPNCSDKAISDFRKGFSSPATACDLAQ